MAFAGTNYIAVFIAAVAAWAFGAAWYMSLGKVWMKAARLDPANMKPSAAPFIISFIAELIMAFVIAGAIAHLGAAQITIGNGIMLGSVDSYLNHRTIAASVTTAR